MCRKFQGFFSFAQSTIVTFHRLLDDEHLATTRGWGALSISFWVLPCVACRKSMIVPCCVRAA